MLNFIRNLLIAIGIVGLLLFSAIALHAAELDLPFPQNTEVILWVRPELVSSDVQLMDLISQSRTVERYLGLLGISMDQVEYAAIFMPYDPAWMDRVGKGVANTLPPNGAMIVKGKFDPAAKYKELKSNGWIEAKHANKKVLWWSTGETYLNNSSGRECLARLGDDKLLIAGSEENMKGVLDVAGAKAPGIESMGVLEDISLDFFENDLAMASAFVKVTDDLRLKIRANAGGPQSAMIRAALGYIDNAQETAMSVIRSSENYLLDGYIGMDNGNTAMVVTGVLQAGGGLASLLPPENPFRETLQNLTVTRAERIIRIQTQMTRAQLDQLVGTGKQ